MKRMKNKRTEVDRGDLNKVPQNIIQAILSLLWPLTSNLKKFIALVILLSVVFFAIWVTVPEKTKTEIIGFIKGSKSIQSPTITSNEKVPPPNITKEILQHTEGDKSPAVISNGDVNISIGNNGKNSKRD